MGAYKRGVVFLLMAMVVTVVWAQVSPLDYGLREASSGMGRYFALLNAHRAALEQGATVDYSGIDTLEIELPPSFVSIPIGNHTDFGGLVLYVTNNVRHAPLFEMHGEAEPLAVDKSLVDGLDFRSVPELTKGDALLILSDATPWTERRGFGYQAYRKDLLLLHDGVGENNPIASWNTEATQLNASYIRVDTSLKVFRALTMHRTPQSTYKTYCLQVSGVCNFLIEDLHVTTPRSKMIADGIVGIHDAARITLKNITIEGTYSGYGRTRNYGYAFSLNNVYDLRCSHITAWGNWGVFGANNMNSSLLEDCDIDRYDVHCYGRDISLRRCRLSKRQTPISSIYGTVQFDSCHFVDFIPVRIRSSYNAYTPFDVVMHDCTLETTLRYHTLVQVDLLDTADNPRPELQEKCLPNLRVDGLTVVVPLTVGRLNIYSPVDNLGDLKRAWGYINQVEIHGLKLQRSNGRSVNIPVHLSSHSFHTSQPLTYTID